MTPADNGGMLHDPSDAPESANPDFSEMERQIQALLGGADVDSAEEPAVNSVVDSTALPPALPTTLPTVPDRIDVVPDVRSEALEPEPIDPLLREIDAALADDADALLRNADGDIESVLRSVFDERALSGQEEEINRALIEAFGTSRVERPSFAVSGTAPAVITNPVPPFEGAARAISPDIPREERDRATMDAADASARTPGALHDDDTPGAQRAPMTEPAATTTTMGANSGHTQATSTEPTQQLPVTSSTTTTSTTTSTTTMPERNAATAEPKPDLPTQPRPNPMDLLHALAAMPLRLAGAPTRMLPASARTVVGLVAITLVLWTPVAWWLAQRATRTPAVAPVTIKPAAVASAEPTGH